MTSQVPIKKLLIVGGGTAGWMAAAAFSRMLGKSLQVTLVESDEIATVGVGEATVPPLVLFNRYLDINEQEFLTEVKGTIKLGISFENWQCQGEKYIHAFGRPGKDAWAASFQHFWRRGLALGIDHPFADYSLETQAALHNKFAHTPNSAISYAYHIDAGLYAKFLRLKAEGWGATRIEGKVVGVQQHPDQSIKSVRLENGAELDADLFIDCSGFRGLLIEQALHTGYEDWSHWLACDSAIAVQTKAVGEAIPYTRSIAHGAGWQWRIPLQHRVGNGLVYSSRFMSDEAARQTLLENIQGELLTEPKVIKYRAGQRLKYWNKNVIALGLASGFIEPLESTSIHLIQRGITRLLEMFPAAGIRHCDRDEYNRQMKAEVLNIRDFIILHYCQTQREDTDFWRFCKNMDIPKSLQKRMEMFSQTGKVFVETQDLFVEASWVQVMLGQGLLPEQWHPLASAMDEAELTAFLADIRGRIQQTIARLPSHQNYIEHFCKAAP